MRKLLFTLLLLPFLALSQNSTEYAVFENDVLTPNPTQISQFERGITAHNKKYHGDGPHGVRVYWISNGPRTGRYVWVMGPFPWSSMDHGPAQKEGHDAYAAKSPNETFGIYTNEFPSTKEGKDLAVISFFDKSAWLGEDHSIAKKYDEMNGTGSWDQFLKDWMDVTNGGETEIWMYVPELSGISGDVKAAARN